MRHSMSIKSAGITPAFLLHFAMLFFVVFGLNGKAYSQGGSAQPSALIHDARLEDEKGSDESQSKPSGGFD